ncbi:hypothetical protein [Candidatus Enterococcus clewellii]|uniref:Uncharacterized protein n=1 Tax=Candidatus Enterococcus clewellii TaxID=1834193 RepID=A0AAQ3VXK5_9ENTE
MKEKKLWFSLIGVLVLGKLTYGLISFGYSIYWGGALAGTYEYGLPLLFVGWIPLVIGIGLIPVTIVWLVLIIRKIIKSHYYQSR